VVIRCFIFPLGDGAAREIVGEKINSIGTAQTDGGDEVRVELESLEKVTGFRRGKGPQSNTTGRSHSRAVRINILSPGSGSGRERGNSAGNTLRNTFELNPCTALSYVQYIESIGKPWVSTFCINRSQARGVGQPLLLLHKEKDMWMCT